MVEPGLSAGRLKNSHKMGKNAIFVNRYFEGT